MYSGGSTVINQGIVRFTGLMINKCIKAPVALLLFLLLGVYTEKRMYIGRDFCYLCHFEM